MQTYAMKLHTPHWCDEMPPSVSKKAESLKAEAKKLEDIAKKKVQAIEKIEKEEEENTRKEVLQISSELERFKKKTEDVMNGTVEGTGWDEQAIRVGEKMKYVIEQESRVQVNKGEQHYANNQGQ